MNPGGLILVVVLIAFGVGLLTAIAFAIDAVIRFPLRVVMHAFGGHLRIARRVTIPSLTVLMTLVTLTYLGRGVDGTGAPAPTVALPTTTPSDGVGGFVGLLPTPAPAPTPTQTPDVDAVIQQELAKLTPGNVAFNPPQSVHVGDATRIEVRIAQDIVNQATLTAGMRGPGTPQVQVIRVSRLMGAELTGENFDIKALDSATQVLEDNQPTAWSWDVKATRPGRQTLHLRIWARVVVPPASEQTKDLPVMDRDVDVQANIPYSLDQFWENNWQWILGGGFTASVAAVFWRLPTLFQRTAKRRSQVRPLR